MSRHVARLSLAGAIALTALLGCGPQSTTQPDTNPNPNTNPVATTPTSGTRAVSFASDVTPLLKAKCADCHTEGRRGAVAVKMFDASGKALHADIKAKITQMVMAVEAGAMPKGGPKLPDSEIQVLKDWQAGGALNN